MTHLTWVFLTMGGSKGSKPFLEAIASYKTSFSQYLGNAIGALIVIVLVVLVIGVMGQIQKWIKKFKRH